MSEHSSLKESLEGLNATRLLAQGTRILDVLERLLLLHKRHLALHAEHERWAAERAALPLRRRTRAKKKTAKQ